MGHIVSKKNGICTDEEKIKVIVNMPRPKNAREVQAFMGIVDIIQDSYFNMPP